MAKFDLNSQAGIIAAIASLGSRGHTLKVDAGKVAIAVMVHLDGAGNGNYPAIALPLFEACDKSFGKAMGIKMRNYFLAFTWLEVNPDYVKDSEEKATRYPFRKSAEKTMKIEDARKEKWFEFGKPESDVTAADLFDAQKAVTNLFKRAATAGKTADLVVAAEAALKAAKAAHAEEIRAAKKAPALASGK